ncbi:MAG: hypothetical protein JW945_03015 [Methanomicrobia archaeon]|nr:hypothetical protein [Methanomicrobia archaeon]
MSGVKGLCYEEINEDLLLERGGGKERNCMLTATDGLDGFINGEYLLYYYTIL